ncbi:hypothetical protein DFJ73DRAFT_636423 [Zopfochytrium polystomum]|nr:hypothetical protein DFJ73DRAFT_636423 [Zopfochytrium polystomum]
MIRDSKSKSIRTVAECYQSGDRFIGPMYVFDSTAVYEMGAASRDTGWLVMYNGITDSSRRSGVYGVLHDNTLVDVRPYEEPNDRLQTEKERQAIFDDRFNAALRTPREDLAGFVCCTYTPANLEAGRICSFCNGTRIRVENATCLDRCRELVSALGRCAPLTAGELRKLSATQLAISSDVAWTVYYNGCMMQSNGYGVLRCIVRWGKFRGHSTPSIHIFDRQRVLVLSTATGCVMRPVIVSRYAPGDLHKLRYVDSMMFNTQRMMEVLNMSAPARTEFLEYAKSYFCLVPYVTWDQPPRTLFASSMSPQAICTPRLDLISTTIPSNRCTQVVRTQIMDMLCQEMDADSVISVPGYPLLVVFCNTRMNYEDAVQINDCLNDMRVFERTGYVVHPKPERVSNVAIGTKLGERNHWWRPSDDGEVISTGTTKQKASYVVARTKSSCIQPGDKLGTRHGQKCVVSEVVPSDRLVTCVDIDTGAEFSPHVVMAQSSVTNRNTIGQVLEAWAGMAAVGVHDFDPTTITSSVCVTLDDSYSRKPQPRRCYLKYPGSAEFVYSVTADGIRRRVIADYGICDFWLLGHLASDKQHYMSSVPRSVSIGKGRLKGYPVRLGEMEALTMCMKGYMHCLSELVDSYDACVVSICTKCRRLSLLCDCPLPQPDADNPAATTNVVMRQSLLKLDIAMMLHSFHTWRAANMHSADDTTDSVHGTYAQAQSVQRMESVVRSFTYS